MNPYKLNTLWESFVLKEIVRPYQTMIGLGDKPVQYLSKKLYASLYKRFENREWALHVLDRIKRAYPEIDCSFFPEDDLGFFMRHALVKMGVIVNYFKY